MSDTINVWIKKPGKDPENKWIINTLGSLQAVVQGYIETVTIADDVVVICNEEGRIRNMPYNCELCGIDFVGPIVIAGFQEDEFTNCPWDMDEMNEQLPQLWDVVSA